MPRKASNWHGYYFGPGNRIDYHFRKHHRPVDRLDAAAEKHDLRYSRLQRKYGKVLPYILPSQADKQFVSDIASEKGLKASLARGFFKAKGLIPFKLTMPSIKRGRSQSRSSVRSRSVSMVGTPYDTRAGGSALSIGVGHYAGKLKRPRKAKRPSKYDKAGFSKEIERYGDQELNHVTYIGCTSFAQNDLGPVIGVAFIRKIMKRHFQFEYTHPDQYVVPTNTTGTIVSGTGPFRIDYWYEELYAADVEPTIGIGHSYEFYAHSTVTRRTVSEAGQDFYDNVLSGVNFGQWATGAYPQRRLHGYSFRTLDYTVAASDPNGDPVGRHSTVFSLKNQYLTCYSAVTLGIQNVTAADDGTSLETTRVDANPIKGKLMKFKDLLPRLEQRRGVYGTTSSDNSYKLQIDPNYDGVIKPNASLIGDWTQVPTASMFSNCTGELSVKFEPGQIKDYSFIFKFNGTLEKLMNGMRYPGGPDVYPLSKGRFGTSILFALEKRMPTGSTGVKVNWHYESRVGCVFGKKLGVLMQRGAVAANAKTTAA